MSIPSSPQAVIVQADAGKELDFGPDGISSVVLMEEQTAGALTVIRATVVPGAGPPLHAYSTEDELFLVVDGHVSFFTDGHWTDVGPGGAAYFPRGVPLCYRNLTDTTSHMWIMTIPSAKSDVSLERLAGQTRRPGGPEMDEIRAMHRDQGVTLIEPV